MMLLLLSLLCSAAWALPSNYTEQSQAYNDVLVRSKLFPLAAAAYAADAGVCVRNALGGIMKRQITAKCESSTCSGYVAVSPNDKAIIISFRGTDSIGQLIQEFRDTLFQKTVTFVSGGKVDYYFNDAFMSVWNAGVKEDFINLLQQYPDYAIWATGHSLGASMASLAASYIVSTGIVSGDRVKLFTFGQPRTGDADFASIHDLQIPNSFRVTHSHDLIVHLPLEIESFYHHKTEVFYQYEDMGPGAKYVICPRDEDSTCSDRNVFDLLINDHMVYFNKKVSEFGIQGCLH